MLAYLLFWYWVLSLIEVSRMVYTIFTHEPDKDDSLGVFLKEMLYKVRGYPIWVHISLIFSLLIAAPIIFTVNIIDNITK